MTFTDKMVEQRAERLGIPSDTPDLRDAVANETIKRFDDWVEAWEIRTGRPWTDMTMQEAAELIAQNPKLQRNPGVLSRLLGVGGAG